MIKLRDDMLHNPRSAWRQVQPMAVLSLAVLFGAHALGKPRALPDQIVATPVGNLRITDLNCDHALGFLFVRGNIVNQTSKSWDTLYLAMEFQDKNGVVTPKAKPNPLILISDPSASAGIIATQLGIGQTLKLRYGESARADSSTFSVIFKFVDGRYPVHYQTALTKPVAARNLEYHDDTLAITFSLQRTEIDFVLQNNSNDAIKIDWNLVSFVQSWGTAQGVIHKGIKLADKQAIKAPSMIPPKAKIEDMIVPVENVEFTDGDWVTHPILFEGPAALRLLGAEFSIFMPLEIAATAKNYTFTFKVIGID
jgi:hypothetical protein